MTLAAGAKLGPYEIQSPIGAGGMGEVYRARDSKLNREVALKILPELFALDTDRLARFKREAQVLASLNHPNIGGIYGFEESNPSPGSGRAALQALVLELVEGPTLAELIAGTASDFRLQTPGQTSSQRDGGSGPKPEARSLKPDSARTQGLPFEDALPIARQIAEALEAAHELGIIHRDLKPSNIKVRPDGTVKVLDFGLAKALAPDAASATAGDLSQSPTITTPAATGMGVIMGTAAYMAPEQAKGKAVDKRADIWAFGCVLYEMITGRRAFEGEDVSETLAAVIKGEPDWRALPRETPAPIRRLLRRCLSKDRKGRIADASIARIEIDEAQNGSQLDGHVVENTPRRRERLAWAIAAVALVTVAALMIPAVEYFREAPAEAPEMRLEINTPPTTDPASLAISPDGQKIVFVATSDGASRLWLRSLGSVSARPLAGTDSAISLLVARQPNAWLFCAWQAQADRHRRGISADIGKCASQSRRCVEPGRYDPLCPERH